jgi:hypothetical protein
MNALTARFETLLVLVFERCSTASQAGLARGSPRSVPERRQYFGFPQMRKSVAPHTSSFPRMRESIVLPKNWIPACAGMTELWTLDSPSAHVRH